MTKIAIRDAYGAALEKLGHQNDRVVALEADLGSSTKSIVFGKSFSGALFQRGYRRAEHGGHGRRHGRLRPHPLREHLRLLHDHSGRRPHQQPHRL